MQRRRRCGHERQRDQGAGNAGIELFGAPGHREYAEADAEGPRVGFAEAGRARPAFRPGGRGRRDAQQRGRLGGDDVDRNARQEAGRNRIESRSAMKPSRKTPTRTRMSDAQRQRGGGRGIVRASRRGRGPRPRRKSSDGRIGADQYPAVRSEDGKADRACDQREKADLRPEPRRAAVAICEGMAITASVNPATRSGPSRSSENRRRKSAGRARAGARLSRARLGKSWLSEGSVPSGT